MIGPRDGLPPGYDEWRTRAPDDDLPDCELEAPDWEPTEEQLERMSDTSRTSRAEIDERERKRCREAGRP